MGWRGLLRSMEAERKRSERLSRRRNRLVDKANNVANKIIQSMADETRRELEKIKLYEEKLSEYPISKCGLQFASPNKWAFDGIADSKGQITYDIKVAFSGCDLVAEPIEILYEKRCFKFINACITNYGTFISFEIIYNRSVSGSKSTKLINRKSPDNSLVAIRSGDDIFFPVEGTVDTSLVDNVRRTGIIVFEPFSEPIKEFDIVFIPKNDTDDQPENVIKITGNLEEIIRNNNFERSIYENFLDKINQQKAEYESRIVKELEAVKESAQQQASQNDQHGVSSCFVFSLLGIGLLFFLLIIGGASISNQKYNSRDYSIPTSQTYYPSHETNDSSSSIGKTSPALAEAVPVKTESKKKPEKMKIVGYVTPEGSRLHKNSSCGGHNSRVVYSTDWQASLAHCSKCW